MAITITAYRARIGIFCNSIKCKDIILKIPTSAYSKTSFDNLKSKSYINLTKARVQYALSKRSMNNPICLSIISITSIIHAIMLIANDIESNPGPISTYNPNIIMRLIDRPFLNHLYSKFSSELIILCNDIELNPGPLGRYLTICHANLRSIKNKMIHINSDLASKFDIITASETWLKPSDSDPNLELLNYQPVYRKDRVVGSLGYGGVLAWVSNAISCKRRADLEQNDLEAIWLEIKNSSF